MPSTVTDAAQLLVQAVQDLFDAEAASAERLAAIADLATDADLARFLADEEPLALAQRDRLESLARDMGAERQGAPNLWQRAILDDATRDGETIERGPLLDIALVGALRKGKQAARVSYETALGLAAALGRDEDAEALEAARDEAEVADEELSAMLERLLAELGDDAAETDEEELEEGGEDGEEELR